ncbi:hypothetical protein PV326_004660 [Microctonus aethiopoides]|nr:hypothetical protein PV326_004660 [Microctonus aethiopoides]
MDLSKSMTDYNPSSSDEGETTLGSGETGVINERCIEIEEQASNIYQEHKSIDDIHPKNHSPQPSIQEKVAAALSSYHEYMETLKQEDPAVEVGTSTSGSPLIRARINIPRGTRFGPFLGRWVGEPHNPRYAWEI